MTEVGRTPLPPIDLDEAELVIGSGEACRLRLPALAVRPRHLVVCWAPGDAARIAWQATEALELDGAVRSAGDQGVADSPLQVVIAGYQLRITAAPTTTRPSTPQRTESLARELIRNIMGGVAPRLVVEVGPAIGSSRTLAPPDSRLTVGRGDEADWVILDEELSRVHAALVRTWDGVRVVDLGSKNGTRVDDELVAPGAEGPLLRDGARVLLGDVLLRYRDDAERYLEPEGDAAPEAAPRAAVPAVAPSRVATEGAVAPPSWVSTALMIFGAAAALAALGAALWLLA